MDIGAHTHSPLLTWLPTRLHTALLLPLPNTQFDKLQGLVSYSAHIRYSMINQLTCVKTIFIMFLTFEATFDSVVPVFSPAANGFNCIIAQHGDF